MKTPFVLVPDTVSNELVECTRTLHDQARRGELIGLAYAGMLRRRGYIANSAGEAFRNPTFSIGMCVALIRKLLTRVDGGNP